MPKLSSFLSVGTAVKVGAGAAVGYFATVGVSSRTDAPEEPAKAEMREEREKKLNFEVQQRSNELDKKEQDLKSMEEVLAKREAALKEERAALLATRTLTTEAVVSSEADAGVVQKVKIVEEPADLKIEQREAVIPAENQTDYVPKRPAVFDGRGNAPVVTNKSSTNGAEPQLLYFNAPSFATGRTPSTDGRDVRPPLSPTVPNVRRFADLKPQHVVSVKATPEGVVVREGRAWTLSSSPEARFGTASDISGAGAGEDGRKRRCDNRNVARSRSEAAVRWEGIGVGSRTKRL